MKLILISGLSGSGKSIALNVLEDAGYYCVDNLPATLLFDVVNFLEDAGQSRAAVSVDARSAALSALPETVARLKAQGIDCRVLFLDASHESLMRRFSETRRRHPLTSSGTGLTLAEAIEQERTMLAGAAGLGHHIDTSGLLPKALRDWIRAVLEIGTGPVTLLFESFSYGQGIPLDADWVIDARMLPNPYYDDELRPLTGQDALVIGYLEGQPLVRDFYADIQRFLARWLPELVRDNRSYLTVAIGCTGGRHRSVYLAEKLAASFRLEWPVLVRHRGLARIDAGDTCTTMKPAARLALAWTGASGMPYGLRLLECLLQAGHHVLLVYSQAAQIVAKQELGLVLPARAADAERMLVERYPAGAGRLQVFGRDDWNAPIASGSNPPDAMVVCPCSMGTLAAIAAGLADNLIERAADVVIKEGRKLVLVPRETPFSALHLENMLKLARLGCAIIPPSPGFYNRPASVQDLVDFVVARILDNLGVEHALVARWGEPPAG